MTEARVADAEGLVELARNKSQKSRSALVAAIGDLYSGESQILTAQDRALMADIMRRLINDVEMSVRRTLSEILADRSDAPRDLVVTLANDEIEVAHPVLVKSEILRDEELIEIIQHRAMEHQVAIAMRQTVSEPVSDALVETNNEKVIDTLLFNQGAAISIEGMDRLVEQSRTVSSYQTALVQRQDLPPQLAKKLYWWVSAALRKHIVETFDLDSNDLDEALETTVKDVFGETSDSPPQQDRHGELTSTERLDDGRGLIELMQKGDILEFVNKFSSLSGLRLGLVRRFLFEEGGEGLAIVCKAIGLEKNIFLSIFLQFRSGRVGDKQVKSDELSQTVSFFNRIDQKSAKALLQRWKRDPDYLNALRMIEQI